VRRILVVEDDEPTRRLLDLILLDVGEHELMHAAAGREALTEISSGAPDLLILDMHLPDMDGLSLFREVRRTGFDGPVLALTASSSRDPLLEALRAEPLAPSVLLKPFDVDELTNRIQALLRGETSAAASA